jgi:hypothetical protein
LFKPSVINPALCRWWVVPPKDVETVWKPFCCHNLRMGLECPTAGRNFQEQEEDSFE